MPVVQTRGSGPLLQLYVVAGTEFHAEEGWNPQFSISAHLLVMFLKFPMWTVLKKMRFYREELSGGKARERTLWPESHTGQGAKSRFDPALSDSQKSSSWGPVATSCWFIKGPVLLLSDMEQLIYLFLLIWKKKMKFGKNGKNLLYSKRIFMHTG